MASKEAAEFTQKIIDHALKGEHSAQEFIRSFGGFLVANTIRKSTNKVVHIFKKASKVAYKKYLEELEKGVDNFQLLLDHRTYNKVADFYKKEYKIALDCMDEYISYALFSGRFTRHVLLGYERPDEDLIDSRTDAFYKRNNE
jgi:hypothetical protein